MGGLIDTDLEDFCRAPRGPAAEAAGPGSPPLRMPAFVVASAKVGLTIDAGSIAPADD